MSEREQLASKIFERVGLLQTLEPDYCRWEYLDDGQKAARGIMLSDLAKWIDDRHAEAVKELERIQG